MKKIIVLIGLNLILSFLTACTRGLEAISGSQNIQSEAEQSEIMSEPTSRSSSIASSPDHTDVTEETVHPWRTSDEDRIFFWIPKGKYFVSLRKNGFDFYNTDNELEGQETLPLPVNGNFNDFCFYPTNLGFYSVICPMYQEEEEKRILWKKGNEYVLTNLVYMDWSGNTLIQRPDIEVRTDEQGEKKFYLDDIEAEPVPFTVLLTLLDEDLLLLQLSHISNTNIKRYYIHYIPSQNKFIDLGWHDADDWSIKTPRGIVWKDSPNLYLTAGETIIQLFQGLEVQDFFVSDEIIVIPQKEYYTEGGYLTPLYYASWKDLELKEIGGTYADPKDSYYLMRGANIPPDYQLMIEGPYILYKHYQDGLIVYDTQTDESFKIKESWADIEDIRIKDGEWEAILYGRKNGPDSDAKPTANPEKGYFVVTKDKTDYYPKNYDGHKYEINPQRTHYIYVSGDDSTFCIKPCIPIPGEDE